MSVAQLSRADVCVCPVARHAADRPDAVALVQRQPRGPSTLWRYEQLHQQVDQRHRWLQRQGVAPGQHLLAVIDDKTELVRLLIASLRLGCVLIPLNPALPLDRLHTLIDHCDSAWLIADNPALSVAGAGNRLELDPIDTGHTAGLTTSSTPPAQATPPIHLSHYPIRDTQAPLTGTSTSGSTGSPKLALHSFDNHRASANGSRTLIPLQPGDGWALSLPLYHIGGLATVFRCLLAGASLIVPAVNESLPQLLGDRRLSHLSAVTTQLLRLRRQGFDFGDSAVRHLLVGGGAIPTALLQWLEQQPLQCLISYGLTEMSSQVMTGPANPAGQLASLLPHCQLRLADDGEILLKGESLFLGYYRNGCCERPLDDQGWFHSRDLGELDAQQRLTIRGRLDNQFISGGENIQPEAIEQVVRHYPKITECVVVPVADASFGQRPVAFIQPYHGIDSTQLSLWLRQQLAGYQIPIRYLPLPVISASLKISRAALMVQATEALQLQPPTHSADISD